MIINNTNVKGIWAYSDGLVFEIGDFVVKGDQIFICNVPGATGDPEENPDLYSRYPGNMVSDLEEYKRIIDDPEGSEDLYISSKLLHAVLQDTYFGLGDSGIIDSRIEADGSLRGQIASLKGEGNTLDLLLTSKSFNNGVVLVSRNLQDIQNVIGEVEPVKKEYIYEIVPEVCTRCGACQGACPVSAISLGEDSYEVDTDSCTGCGECYNRCPVNAIIKRVKGNSGNDLSSAILVARADLDYVFLRQYTYRSGASGYLHRIQELVDPAYGKIYFRHSRQVSASGELEIESTDWKSCIASTDIKSIEDEIQKIRDFMSKANASQDSIGFRFRSLNISEENNGEYAIDLSQFEIDQTNGKKIVTVYLESVPGEGIPKKTYSSTIDLSGMTESDTSYYVSRDVILLVHKYPGNNEKYVLSISSGSSENYIIKDIYCREVIYGYTGYSV